MEWNDAICFCVFNTFSNVYKNNDQETAKKNDILMSKYCKIFNNQFQMTTFKTTLWSSKWLEMFFEDLLASMIFINIKCEVWVRLMFRECKWNDCDSKVLQGIDKDIHSGSFVSSYLTPVGKKTLTGLCSGVHWALDILYNTCSVWPGLQNNKNIQRLFSLSWSLTAILRLEKWSVAF